MISASLRVLLTSVAASAVLSGSVLAQTQPQTPAQTPPPVPTAPTPHPADTVQPDPAASPEIDEEAPDEDTATAAPAAPTTPPIPAVWSPVPRDENGHSAYGLYLSGRVAMARGEGTVGAEYLAAASELVPEQPSVRDRAFAAVLLAGGLDVAARLAPPAEEASPTLVQAGVLVRAVQEFAHGRARTAHDALTATPVRTPHARAGLMIAPWVAAAAGDWTGALAQPPANADPITAMFARQNRALLLENRGQLDQAEAEFKTLVGYAQAGALFRLPYGQFLERRGRRDEALALYDAAIASGQADELLRRARMRAADGGRPVPAPTFRQGAASALINAAAQAAAERAPEFSAFYLRLAMALSPSDETRFRLGQALSRSRMTAASREVLSRIGGADASLYAAAQVQIGLSLDEDDQQDAALEAFRRAHVARPDDAGVARVLAGQMNQQERYEEALALLNGPLLNTEDQGFDVHFLRGAAYESLGRMAEAEAELWAALQKEPENATVLNYLGYLWVDQGTRVEQGAEMIARAFAAEPDNGNIQDSLGWAQYRQGQYDDAVLTLEAAVQKLPANPEINDHLGDAYWQVGRQREARFQWERVLTLDPDDDQAARARRKLEQGLEAAAGAQP
ncbi:MAG TPA: tetratricopeptide repeat protein [Brevundimonas sp.]|uniref:tetratricopeptide repeat protein n=1 Tax=Brevundimonas sp. TaxID=1871086 RepID=UPI002620ACB7|nr:tetratricopeptide repeat protein [Brevundimonas sp.]HRO31923.1 tetratricopeptide repeat protein [Brevundimonas sp.]